MEDENEDKKDGDENKGIQTSLKKLMETEFGKIGKKVKMMNQNFDSQGKSLEGIVAMLKKSKS